MNRNTVVVKAVVFCFLLIVSCTPRHPEISTGNGVQTDPAVISGILPNGFQYLLMKNPVPKDRVSIYLNIFAGSLNEAEDEQGVAHYLEHMLFNGSNHFKPGELIEYFQSIGMEFGSDANAHTGFFNTVYSLSLPASDQKHLGDAFTVIEDYAGGASLLDSEINRERGIILAEKRERDSVSNRTFKKTLEFELPESILNQRFPIGIDSVIHEADQKLLKTYYDKWYRPDNMALIAVGDFDITTIEKLIKEKFSKLSARSLYFNSPPSTRWEDHEKTKAFYYYEPEAGSTHISVETIAWKDFVPETFETLKSKTLAEISNSMLQNRLLKMVNDQTVGFSDVSVFSGAYLQNVSISAIHAICEPEKWQETLIHIESALRQGLVHGFETNELDRVKAGFLSDLDMDVNQSETRKSPDIADKILKAVNQKEMLLSAKQRRTILEPYIKSISLKDTHDMLVKLWPKDKRLILVTGNSKLIADQPETEILDIYTETGLKKIEKYEGSEKKIFPYLEIPEPPTALIKKRDDNVHGLGITTIDFSNNVRLNFKQTDFKKNEILFKICFGEGKKSEPVSKPGLSFISETVVKKSGLGQLTADQMEEILAGHKIDIGFDINDNNFSLSGFTDPEDIELLFQLIYHYLKDPGIRNEALKLSKIQYRQMYDSLMRKPEGIMRVKGDRFLAKNDLRFGLSEPPVIEQYTLIDIMDWLIPYFENSPVEVSITGDIDINEIISYTGKYLGALNQRNDIKHETMTRPQPINFPEGELLDLKIDTKIETGVVHVAFLTDDFWDISQTRRLSLLSKIFSEKLRLVIREEFGESYSPYVYNDPSLIFDDYGIMHVVVNATPEKHEFVNHKIEEIVKLLISERISDKDMDTVLQPVINHLKVYVKTNEYWLNSVMTNSYIYPQKFEWAGTLMDDYNSITKEDLFLLANKFLQIKKRALIRIKPSQNF
ncbi:MAG: zinc protease [Bdellovibrionales bacterium RIFOXYB2_FULL_36_6]|nr:MAG: zinc protease [Bdellovibrionales bacterium RIFOXYB2_FULL_36_6]